MNKSCALLILLIFSGLNVHSQDPDTDFLNLEFEFGLGYAQATENNLFNDPQGIDPGGGFGINMAFRYHLDYNWSAGIHVLIVVDEIQVYDPDQVLGYYSDLPLSTSNMNVGFNGKYTYNLGRWQPYIGAGLGAAIGGITTQEYEESVNKFVGIALDLGIGAGYMASNQLMVSTTLTRNYGVAWWKYAPSYDSINNQFNPGFWSLTLNVNVFFGGDEFY